MDKSISCKCHGTDGTERMNEKMNDFDRVTFFTKVNEAIIVQRDRERNRFQIGSVTIGAET